MANNSERLLENRWAAPAWMRPMLREAAEEIERLRAEVKELRQHRCLWGNDPSGPYVPDEYIYGVPHAAATACDVTRANDATGHQSGQ